MLKQTLAVLFALTITGCAIAQTKSNLSDSRPVFSIPTPPTPALVMNFPAAQCPVTATGANCWLPVLLDTTTLTLDTTVSPPVIRAKAAAGTPQTDQTDEFVVSTTQTSFTTSNKPVDTLRVFRNGMLQRPLFDYTQAAGPGNTITITYLPAAGLTAGDYITFTYHR